VALLALAFLGSVHAYLIRRLVLEPGVPEPWRSGLAALVVVLGLAVVAQPIAERWIRPPTSRAIAWPAALWMGFAFLILIQLLATDLLLWLAGPVARAAAPGIDAAGSAPAWRAALVAGLALLAGSLAIREALRPPRLRQLEVRLARWPAALDGFRIVQISDIHIGPILGRRFARELTERVNALRPDLLAVTGDLVDGSVRQLEDEVAPFAALRARHGAFFVTGNHDHYSGVHDWDRKARELGLRVLRNQRCEIRDGGAVFDLAGVDDHRGDLFGSGGEDLDAALAGRDPDRPCILLAHDPSTFKRASQLSVDLQLSGHTHGGQIWPFGWFVRLAIPWVFGRHRRGAAQLYVSRGTGFWGPPMRLFAPAEITEITLRTA
jgi:predicted MPP superfamily phosphohydrolase